MPSRREVAVIVPVPLPLESFPAKRLDYSMPSIQTRGASLDLDSLWWMIDGFIAKHFQVAVHSSNG
jgi:hypothetical protein